MKLDRSLLEACPPAPPRALVAYADGACEPINPGGTASLGVVVYDEQGQELVAESAVVAQGAKATNNVAEFAAASRALALVRAMALPRGSRLTLHGDSQLWVKILNGVWRARTPAAPYWPHYEQAAAELARLRADGIDVTIAWVPREQNQRADALSKCALPPPELSDEVRAAVAQLEGEIESGVIPTEPLLVGDEPLALGLVLPLDQVAALIRRGAKGSERRAPASR